MPKQNKAKNGGKITKIAICNVRKEQGNLLNGIDKKIFRKEGIEHIKISKNIF